MVAINAYALHHPNAARRGEAMITLAVLALFTASVVAAASTDDAPFGPITVDLHYWGNVLVWTVGVLIAGTWLWQRTGARGVRWLKHQGEVHEQVLDKLTQMNTKVSDLDRRLSDVERRGQ